MTNSAIFMLGTTFFIISIFSFVLRNPNTKTPNKVQGVLEFLFRFIKILAEENIGTQYQAYFPLIFSLFLFLLVGNLAGLFPLAFTFTSHLIVTFALALVVFLLSIIISVQKFGIGFFGRFIPEGTPWALVPIIVPIEVVSFIFRPISLAMRLFANMIAGHIILKVFASFVYPLFNASSSIVNSNGILGNVLGVLLALFPIVLNMLFLGLEFLVAVIQAYIFTVISCIYIQDSLEEH